MKKLAFAFVALLGLLAPAHAQPKQIVTTCGTFLAGSPGDSSAGTVNTTGQDCVSAVVAGTVTISGTISPTARTAVSSSALAANQVVLASAGSLYSFDVQADSTLAAAAWWIMIYNATSAPVDGAVTPVKCYQMAPGAIGMSAAFPNPIAFSTGITIGVSTTGCFTKTASTHAFISGDY